MIRPAEVAAETGTSLRYVQKLLAARGCTSLAAFATMLISHGNHGSYVAALP
jgi:hypothetical protein